MSMRPAVSYSISTTMAYRQQGPISKKAHSILGRNPMVLFPDGELAVCLLDPLLWCVVIIQQSQLESTRIAGLVVKLHISTGSSPFGVPKHSQVSYC